MPGTRFALIPAYGLVSLVLFSKRSILIDFQLCTMNMSSQTNLLFRGLESGRIQ